MLEDVTEVPAQRGDLDERFRRLIEDVATALARDAGSHVFEPLHDNGEDQKIRDEFRRQARLALGVADVRQTLVEVHSLTGALTNARAVASDRISDLDKICRDVMRERDEARAAIQRIRDLAEQFERDGLRARVSVVAADMVRAALNGTED